VPRLPQTDLSDDSFYAVLGTRPEIFQAWKTLDLTLLGDPSSTLPASLKEEVRRNLAQGVGCRYCATVGGGPRAEHPDAREALAVAFADQVVQNNGSIDDAMFGVLREEFTDEQIVELCAWVCFKFGANVLGALMKLEPASEEQLRSYGDLLNTVSAA
jgi:alkylhydroperoxidase family enzyme